MARIADVEIRSNDALNIIKNNEIIISDILRKHESLKGELNTKIVEITQKVQKKSLIESEDLRNWSMRS